MRDATSDLNQATDQATQADPTAAMENQASSPASMQAGATAQAASQGQTPTGTPDAAPQTATPAQPGSKWANVIKGALTGLAMGGAAGFVQGAVDPTGTRKMYHNRQSESDSQAQQAAANVKFTSAQSASIASETAMRQIQAEQLPQEMQMRIQKNDLDTVKFLTDHGAAPAFTTDGAHPEALQAALQSSSDSNGGVPAIATFHVGDKLVGFDISQLGTNTGVLSQINKTRAVQGLPAMDSATFFNSKITSPAAKTKMIADSLQFFNPVPKSGDALKGQLQQYKNYLAQAQTSDDSTDTAENVAKLKNAVDVLQKTVTQSADEKLNLAVTAAKARASAINMTKGVEVAGDNGSTKYTTMGDAIAKGAVGASTAKSLAPLEKTAEDAEKAYSMFQDSYDDYKKGAPTGAQSMLALSQHLATTFGNTKGSRITKDLIQEHLGARSVGDSALVAVQKFTNGDALSPDQWDAFKGLIGQSRKYAWATYSTTAGNKGINVRGMVPKDLGGQNDIRNPGTANQPTTNPPGQAAGGKISVTDPSGGVHNFPNQAAADTFKKLAKIQ